MKGELKGQDCFDHDPIERWSPDRPDAVDYSLCLHIGPSDGEGAELFYVRVLSEEAALRKMPRGKAIVVPYYSWEAVVSEVNKILNLAEGADWDAITDVLKTRFDWEFKNYRPYEGERNERT